MTKKQAFLAGLTLLTALALSPGLAGAPSMHGDDNEDHKAVLHRANCAQVATATDNLGFVTFEFDDQELDIEVALKRGMPRTQYRAFVLTAPCNVVFVDGVLTTNRKGKGHVEIEVPASTIPAGAHVAVQLVSPPGAVVPGPGPFTDLITSDFVLPQKEDD